MMVRPVRLVALVVTPVLVARVVLGVTARPPMAATALPVLAVMVVPVVGVLMVLMAPRVLWMALLVALVVLVAMAAWVV